MIHVIQHNEIGYTIIYLHQILKNVNKIIKQITPYNKYHQRKDFHTYQIVVPPFYKVYLSHQNKFPLISELYLLDTEVLFFVKTIEVYNINMT